jgi:hypothetical protein
LCFLEALRKTSKLAWECRQALCALSSWNKVTLLWVSGHCGIQRNEEAYDALARKRLSSAFLGSKPAISISLWNKVEKWLEERQSKDWDAAPSMRQSKFFIGRLSDKLSWNLIIMDRKYCRIVTGLLTGH